MLSREWQKSTRSQAQGDCVEVRLGPEWQKSTSSQPQGNCVELRQHADMVQIRDSKLGDASPILDLDTATFTALLADLKRR
ncbi:hypothetical protein GCM10029992_07300 [Glycomyces albus]